MSERSSMSNPHDFDWTPFSPATMFRDWIAKSEAQWSQTVSELTKDPRASSMLNRQIDEARMMQRMFAEFAQGSLAMANLPSRSDVEALDERMGRIEDGLAALGAEVVRLREALGPRTAVPTPSRARRPPPLAPKEVAIQPVRPERFDIAQDRPVEGQRTNKASTSPARKANRQKARPDPSRTSRASGTKR